MEGKNVPCPITASCPFSIVLRHGCTAGKLTSCSKNHSINFCLYGCSFARMQCTVLVPKKSSTVTQKNIASLLALRCSRGTQRPRANLTAVLTLLNASHQSVGRVLWHLWKAVGVPQGLKVLEPVSFNVITFFSS